jgi:hypothetical protein
MGSNDHPPLLWIDQCYETWDKLTSAVEEAVESLEEDAVAGPDNNWSPNEEPHPDLIADILEWIAKCYREGFTFTGEKQSIRLSPDDEERI